MYDAVQPFAQQNPNLAVILQEYEQNYVLSQDHLRNPERSLAQIEDARMALGESRIADIDGNTIRGSGGEKLEMSGRHIRLSLEGAGGLELEVAQIQRPDLRNEQIALTAKQQDLETRLEELTGLEAKGTALRNLSRQLAEENPEVFDDDTARAQLLRQILRRFPGMPQLTTQVETAETGQIFLRTIVGFLDLEAETTARTITTHKAEIARLQRDIGVLQAGLDIKRRLSAEKIRERKERVSATQAFYDRLGVSYLVAQLWDIFARVSPANPIVLPDGTVVSSVDLATLRI